MSSEFIFLMHDDAVEPVDSAKWGPYLTSLNQAGVFRGGSSIGAGRCFRKSTVAPEISAHLTGHLRIEAGSLEEAQKLLAGNPVFEAGGTVEIRELPNE